jgi:hypothetical protein
MSGIVVALAVLAGAVVVADLLAAAPTPVPGAAGGAAANRGLTPGSARFAEEEGPAPSSSPKYRLPQQALMGLPAGIELQLLARRFGQGQGPLGIQYFQSPAGLSGMFLHKGDGLQAKPLRFLARGDWTFLPDKRFQQRDLNGNRLFLSAGKAQVFNSAGLQLGALQDPGLGLLYNALLRLTM